MPPYKWTFSHKKYGTIQVLASNYKELLDILEHQHSVDLKQLNYETLLISVLNQDNTTLSKEELKQAYRFQ